MVPVFRLSLVLVSLLLAGCASNGSLDEESEVVDDDVETPGLPDYSSFDAFWPFSAPVGTDSAAQTVAVTIVFDGGTLEYEIHVTRGAIADFTVSEPAACAATVDAPMGVGNGDAWVSVKCSDSLPHGALRFVVELGGLADGYVVFHESVLPGKE